MGYEMDTAGQGRLRFLRDSPWSDHDVRLTAARYAIAAMEERDPMLAWVIDDTGFLKQGKHSVGVQRQYTGSALAARRCCVMLFGRSHSL